MDFEDLDYQFSLTASHFWWLELLDFRQAGAFSGNVKTTGSEGLYIKSCVFRDGANSNIAGIQFSTGGTATLDSCTFHDTDGIAVYVTGCGPIDIFNCTIDAGSVDGASLGVYAVNGTVNIWDSVLAGDNAFDSYAINVYYGSVVRTRNVTYGTYTVNVTDGSHIYAEDDDGFENHIITMYEGIVSRYTTSPRSGGADSSAQLSPTFDCGPNAPLVLGDTLPGFSKIWTTANAASTITVYARVNAAWASGPTAAQFYIEASYLDSAGDAGRTILQSTEQITNDAAWTAFTVTVPASNPKKDGFVYVWAKLAYYESGKYVDVDIKPVVA